MAKNDEYNDEYLCRDFFVGFNFWISFEIPEFRVHWLTVLNSIGKPESGVTTLFNTVNSLDQCWQITSLKDTCCFANRIFLLVQDGTVSLKNIQFIDHVVGVKEIMIKSDDLTCYQRIEV